MNPFLSGSPLERFVHVAATLGWRFRFGDSFFFDAAAGPIVNVERAFYGSEPGDPRSSTTVTSIGLLHNTASSSSPQWYTPNVDLGIGFEF